MTWYESPSTFMIAVLAGGDSPERCVSLASGARAASALTAARHRVQCFDPAVTDLAGVPWSRFDCCFIALHGGAGEDGRVQQQLDRCNIPYTGSGPVASRLAMSKSASKERFFQAGVATLPYVLFHAGDPPEQIAAKIAPLGYPLAIKPDGAGSSLGVGLARGPEDLPGCLAECFRYDAFGVAEPWIKGREMTISIMGRRALPLLEIITPEGFFDYRAKYESASTEYRFQTGLPKKVIGNVQSLALAAARSLRTRGLVRVDLMLQSDGCPFVLEVNTVPGLTEHSLSPKAAAQAGFDMPALCDWMVRDCLGAEISR